MTINYGGKRGKKRKKEERKKVGMWLVISEIYWWERNNKNKWHMYLSTGGIKWIDNIFFPILH